MNTYGDKVTIFWTKQLAILWFSRMCVIYTQNCLLTTLPTRIEDYLVITSMQHNFDIWLNSEIFNPELDHPFCHLLFSFLFNFLWVLFIIIFLSLPLSSFSLHFLNLKMLPHVLKISLSQVSAYMSFPGKPSLMPRLD